MDVSVILSESLDDSQNEVLERFKEFQQAMIDKDEPTLNEVMNESYTLTHMSGKIQRKKEFIIDIMEGVLNYYHSTIKEPKIMVNDVYAKLTADVELDAKVYGIKGSWTLKTNITMKKIDEKWYMSQWDN